ncbi:cell division protein FtsQ/DivIB [Lyngbya sp. PCC 8106]|uniref:cell division protein FtsQ/DivIB n=1 Tax=Lyngbya sp. (strain PCC 8106) TaxID=313612 RepID=UPI00030FBF87|nr:FtsQ-type POTRA domain-containing protein [Lyngbya sp. PCC 8106]
MTNIVSVSSNELGNRRQQLRRHRRLRLVQIIWQALAVSGLTGGVFWAVNQPIWLINQPEQVTVEGNQLLSDRRIRALLPLSYPQSLWEIQPQALAKTLESQGQIAKASVSRQLFPPQLTIKIQERRPVAIAQPSPTLTRRSDASQVGWLDANGGWIPLESYAKLERSRQLPSLKVIGNPEQYRPHWKQMYETLSRSPVMVSEINWQNPANLMITTEIGVVHLGAYSPLFTQQLRVLDQMRNLPQQVDLALVDYIDLQNPDHPVIQMLPEP